MHEIGQEALVLLRRLTDEAGTVLLVDDIVD